MSSLSTHVLDAVRGAPASGVHVELYVSEAGTWARLASAETDADGRAGFTEDLSLGSYRLEFATGAHFARWGVRTFYPEVVVSFVVADQPHYHVPLLLSPYAYSTYRGS
jgi:5-hydroxyisourate hydrolase